MKKWYPILVFGALMVLCCSMTIEGTLSRTHDERRMNTLSSYTDYIGEDYLTASTPNYLSVVADTQVINMPLSAARTESVENCDATVLFQNSFEHLYPDTVAHRDTLTLCAADTDQRVYITFTQFEVAAGDTLYVYDSDSIQVSRQIAAFSGVGVSATGGWIQSECNPSGCLTFQFVTNGDNAKGIGWEAWVSCRDLAATTLTFPTIPTQKLECDETYALVTISPPTPLSICGENVDSFQLTVYNAFEDTCIDSCIQAPTTITDTFAIGLYKAVWKSKKFPSFAAEQFFTVQGPSLVCNDEVYTPLGSSCALDIYPDMLLESPCDTISDTLYYRIEVEIDTKKGLKTIVGGGGPGIPYPTISRDTLRAYGISDMCAGSVKVNIFQVYYSGISNFSICNNGQFETSCSTLLRFEDLTPPAFVDYMPLDTIVACDTFGLVDALTPPTVVDNCDTAFVQLREVELRDEIGPCGTGKVVLMWEAQDFCGNTSVLMDSVTILRPTEFYNPTRVTLSCDANESYLDAERPGLLVGEFRNGSLIPKDTIALSTTDYICGYILLSEDNQFPSNCGEKWIREWKVLDWCATNSATAIGTQVISITDTLAPTFIDCPDSSAIGGVNNPMLIDLGPFECAINMTPDKIVAPQAIDNCDPSPMVAMFEVAQLVHGQWDTLGTNLSNAGALSCDTFRIGWTASDACIEQPKQDTCYKYFIIRDVTKPTAVCTDQLNYAIGNDVARIINVDEIDAGSYDACGIANREISLDGITWSQEVILACEAIHDDPQIHLRITDTKGNQNICWTRINVIDDIFPSCGKLPDVNLFCDEFKSGELGASTDTNGNGLFDEDEYIPLEGEKLITFNSEYGDPLDICEDNITCHPMTIEQQYQLVDLPCGQTRIMRRYRAIDWGPNRSPWETQTIALQYRPNWSITLPADWQGECGADFPEPNLGIQSGACDQIAWEHEDRVFEIEGDACYKVERTYHIINWCLYSAGDQPVQLNRVEDDHGFVETERTFDYTQFPTTSYFTYIQVLRVHSFEGPTITINDVETCLTGDDSATGTNIGGCNEMRTFTAEASTCIDFATLDFWWTIFIDGVEVESGQGEKFNYPVNPGQIYTVQFFVNDGCGNGSITERNFEFFDCKKPTAYCRNGLNIEMGEEGLITVWAADFDLGGEDNCTSQDALIRRVWHFSLGNPPSTNEDILALPTRIDFDCNFFGTQIVRLYVGDESGNWSFCVSSVDVQDNMGVCQPAEADAFVTGKILTADDKLMNDVTVTATTAEGNTIATVTKNGSFQFNLPKNNSYSVRPELDTNPLNGVTTFDLVLISKHILGLQSFNSPYQYIAADINQSGTISAYDLVQLRQLILSITPNFPNNTSWRFVDEAYSSSQAHQVLEGFPESIELTDMDDLMEIGFMAVKIGDVNQSANFGNTPEATSRNFVSIEVADQKLEAGQTYSVDFFLPADYPLEGYQFTIDFEHLEFIELVEASAKKHNFGFNLTEKGLLTTSWNTESGLLEDTRLFSLVVKAHTDGLLSEQLRITSDITPAEAYDAEGNINNVKIQFQANSPTDIQLYQNRPNPFREVAAIGFYLPEAGKADLTILDVQGRVLRTIEGIYEKGYHEVQINANNLPDKGVLYYQLTTDKKQVVKRMIVIE